MRVRIDINKLSDTAREEFGKWRKDTCNPVLNKAYKVGAEEAKRVLRKGGPYKEHTGKYTKDWSTTERKSIGRKITGTESYSTYNRNHYQLTHLLQNGHASRNGGRVRAYPHIDKAEEKAEQAALEYLEDNLGG